MVKEEDKMRKIFRLFFKPKAQKNAIRSIPSLVGEVNWGCGHESC